MTKKRTNFDASRLAVATGGTGEPAIFVHGFGASKSVWRRVCHGLRNDFSCYAIDLPGCGESPAPTHFQYTLEHFADVLTDFIIMKDLKNLTLVGASLGGAVILVALLRNRHRLGFRVKSICLIDAVAYPQEFPLLIKILRTPFVGPFALNFPFFVDSFAPLLGPLPIFSLWHRYTRYYPRRKVREAMIKTARLIRLQQLSRYVRHISKIHLPALVIWGREDTVIPLKFGKRLARDLANSRLIVLDHCGHRPHAQCPNKVITALKEFAQTARQDVSSVLGHKMAAALSSPAQTV